MQKKLRSHRSNSNWLKPDEQERLNLLTKGIEIGQGMADIALKKCWRCGKKWVKTGKHSWRPQPCKHYPMGNKELMTL